MPRVSVIVPVYKVEPYLRRCVDSILAQTFTDFELILVDDGSPDNCGVICDDYARKDARVHVIHQANGGLSAARNAGIDWVFANSDCEWISFVDSDDWVHPAYLQTLYDAVQSCDVNMAICGFDSVEEFSADYSTEKVEPVIMPAEQVFISRYAIAMVAWTKIYHRTCFERIRFPVGRICEDAFVTHRILLEQDYIAVCDVIRYHYFQRQDSIMHSPWSEKCLDRIEAHECRLSFLKDKYPGAFKLEMVTYSYVLATEIARVKKSGPEYIRYERMLRRKLRGVLLRYRTFLPKDIIGKEWVFEAAFPKLMTIYWYKEAAKRKLRFFLHK